MNSYNAILSYDRLSECNLQLLKNGLDQLHINVCWIAAHDGEQNQARRFFPHTSFIRWASYRFSESWDFPLNKKLYDQILGLKKSTVLQIMERYGPFEGGSMEAEVRLMHDFSIAYHMIKESNPDVIIFSKTIESGLEYCLYMIGKYFKIHTIFPRMGLFSHSWIISTELESPILDEEWNPTNAILKICNLPEPGNDFSPITKQKINNIREENLESIPDYMRHQGVALNEKNEKYVNFNPKFSYYGVIRNIVNRTNGDFFKYKLLRYSENLTCSLDEIDWSQKIFYFPLHYQPELTSMPLGGEYSNQIKIIKMISDNLSNDEILLVKEHPSSFSSILKTNSNFRNPSFYRWINRIPRVKLVSVYASSSYLMNHCAAVITITGTAGLEAMIRKKPVLAFGNASYLNGPGVFHIKDEQDIQKALNGINIKISDKDVNKFIKALEGCGFHLDTHSHDMSNYQEAIQQIQISVLLKGLQWYCNN